MPTKVLNYCIVLVQTASELEPPEEVEDFSSAVESACRLTDEDMADESPDSVGSVVRKALDMLLPSELSQVTGYSSR